MLVYIAGIIIVHKNYVAVLSVAHIFPNLFTCFYILGIVHLLPKMFPVNLSVVKPYVVLPSCY